MTTPKRTRASRAQNKETTVGDATLQVVGDDTEKSKRTVIRRDLTQSGLGMVGGFEDVTDDNAVPATAKESNVSYLFEPLAESYTRGSWKSTVVQDQDAAERAIRLAALKLDYGVKIRTEAVQFEDVNGDTVDGVRIFFKAGEKKVRKASQGE